MVLLSVIAVVIGVSLGLIGAGGAIVAVPALVYIGGIDPRLASGYALFMVAVASSIVSIEHLRQRRVHLPSVLAFGSTTIISILLVRRYVAPHVPPTPQMLAFGAVLLLAAIRMLRPGKPPDERQQHPTYLAGYGLIIGAISGILGVGGGFFDDAGAGALGRTRHEAGRGNLARADRDQLGHRCGGRSLGRRSV